MAKLSTQHNLIVTSSDIGYGRDNELYVAGVVYDPKTAKKVDAVFRLKKGHELNPAQGMRDNYHFRTNNLDDPSIALDMRRDFLIEKRTSEGANTLKDAITTKLETLQKKGELPEGEINLPYIKEHIKDLSFDLSTVDVAGHIPQNEIFNQSENDFNGNAVLLLAQEVNVHHEVAQVEHGLTHFEVSNDNEVTPIMYINALNTSIDKLKREENSQLVDGMKQLLKTTDKGFYEIHAKYRQNDGQKMTFSTRLDFQTIGSKNSRPNEFDEDFTADLNEFLTHHKDDLTKYSLEDCAKRDLLRTLLLAAHKPKEFDNSIQQAKQGNTQPLTDMLSQDYFNKPSFETFAQKQMSDLLNDYIQHPNNVFFNVAQAQIIDTNSLDNQNELIENLVKARQQTMAGDNRFKNPTDSDFVDPRYNLFVQTKVTSNGQNQIADIIAPATVVRSASHPLTIKPSANTAFLPSIIRKADGTQVINYANSSGNNGANALYSTQHRDPNVINQQYKHSSQYHLGQRPTVKANALLDQPLSNPATLPFDNMRVIDPPKPMSVTNAGEQIKKRSQIIAEGLAPTETQRNKFLPLMLNHKDKLIQKLNDAGNDPNEKTAVLQRFDELQTVVKGMFGIEKHTPALNGYRVIKEALNPANTADEGYNKLNKMLLSTELVEVVDKQGNHLGEHNFSDLTAKVIDASKPLRPAITSQQQQHTIGNSLSAHIAYRQSQSLDAKVKEVIESPTPTIEKADLEAMRLEALINAMPVEKIKELPSKAVKHFGLDEALKSDHLLTMDKKELTEHLVGITRNHFSPVLERIPNPVVDEIEQVQTVDAKSDYKQLPPSPSSNFTR